mmetsp:Transcript_26415/g.74333  ORF Transcript_26415/g.74333 Transcript_26415/m.74333 type:complete len:399 (-) Transcript_26415:43-1239(-)
MADPEPGIPPWVATLGDAVVSPSTGSPHGATSVVATSPACPASLQAVSVVVQPLDESPLEAELMQQPTPEPVGDVDDDDDEGDEGARSGAKKAKSWQVSETVAAVLAVLAANRQSPQAAQVVRAETAKEFYPKFLADEIKKGLPLEGLGIDDSVQVRTMFARTGKNKGKSPLYTRFAEVTKTVQNDLLPLLSLNLGPDKKPPSGKTWAEVMAATKKEWWQRWSSSRKTKAGKPMPQPWSECNWEAFVLFGPFPGAKQFPDFCFGGIADAAQDAPASGRRTARERDAQRKKQKRDEERATAVKERVIEKEDVAPTTVVHHVTSSTATAIAFNNKIWTAQLVMKYGTEQQKERAMSILLSSLEEGSSLLGAQTSASEQSKSVHDGSTDTDGNMDVENAEF